MVVFSQRVSTGSSTGHTARGIDLTAFLLSGVGRGSSVTCRKFCSKLCGSLFGAVCNMLFHLKCFCKAARFAKVFYRYSLQVGAEIESKKRAQKP